MRIFDSPLHGQCGTRSCRAIFRTSVIPVTFLVHQEIKPLAVPIIKRHFFIHTVTGKRILSSPLILHAELPVSRFIIVTMNVFISTYQVGHQLDLRCTRGAFPLHGL